VSAGTTIATGNKVSGTGKCDDKLADPLFPEPEIELEENHIMTFEKDPGYFFYQPLCTPITIRGDRW